MGKGFSNRNLSNQVPSKVKTNTKTQNIVKEWGKCECGSRTREVGALSKRKGQYSRGENTVSGKNIKDHIPKTSWYRGPIPRGERKKKKDGKYTKQRTALKTRRGAKKKKLSFTLNTGQFEGG